MATTSQNTQTRHQLGFIRSAIDATVNAGAINAGDLVYSTGSGVASLGSGLVLNAALVALIGKVLGVSKDQNPLKGGISNPLLDVGIYQTGEFAMGTTAADTYTHLAPVTVGADAQTITLAPVPAAPGAQAVASGAGGTWTAAAHSVQFVYQTALGETTAGPATVVTPAAGNNIVVTLTAAPPSWASQVNIYVDGVYAGSAPSTAAVTLAGPLTGIASTKQLPVLHALAIGYAYMPLSISTPGGQTASVAGGAGVSIGVRLNVAASKIDGLI